MGRATATILFTDLVGSTELRSQLGDTAADELRRRHDDVLTKAVADHGGRVVKGLGDGIMATFAGAADAVGAAVAIQQGIDRLNRAGKAPAPLEVRIGLSAGDVTLEDDDVHGTPVIEASRLCGAAAGGEILAADLVRALAGSTTEAGFASVGPLELKGLAQPVPAVRVEWEPAATSAIPLPALLTNVGRIFVGRDTELDRLGQLWKEAAAGERRVALLAGEPGVGKTRLAAEVAEAAHEAGAVVLAGRCDEDLGVPFQPFVEALHHYAANASEPSLGRYGGELTRLVPELSSKVPGLSEPLRSDPETERYRLFDAVATWLAAVSADDPVLLVLDDVHWAAKPTLLLLRHILRSAEPLRLLVVATYRDSEVGRGHPLAELLADLRRVEGVERLPLTGLDQAGVAAFIEAAAGHALAEDDEGLPRAVWTETEGNPFFVVEVLRHLAETGGVEQRDGRWVMTAPVDQLGIPEGVRDVVGRRLSRLSEAANRGLWVASVVGLEFDPAVVRMAGDLTDEALFSSLEEAVTARLISEAGSRYRFSHALVRATLYDEMTAARRVALHRKVAEAIETIHAGALDDHLPALAHHWARASAPAADTTRAVDYATRAGDRALAQLAHDEAVAYYRQALEILEASGVPALPASRVGLSISLGEAQRRAGDLAFRETLLDAGRQARKRGDAIAMARAALANFRGTFSLTGVVDRGRVEALEAAISVLGNTDERLRARLLATLAVELTWSDERERRQALSDEALVLARRHGDADLLGSVIALRWTTLWHFRFARERLDLADELLAIAARLGDPNLRFWGFWRRGLAAVEMADLAPADSAYTAAARQAADLAQPFPRLIVAFTKAVRALMSGRLASAEHQASELVATTQGVFADAETLCTAQLAGIRYDQGRLAELEPDLSGTVTRLPNVPFFKALLALAQCEAGRSASAQATLRQLTARPVEDLVDGYFAAPTAAALSLVCAELGCRAEAASLVDIIAPCADQVASHPTMWMGCFSHHLGVLERTLGRFSSAQDHFARAAETHARMDAPTWLARTRLEWARMLLERRGPGDVDRARELVSQALATAKEFGLGGVERQAVALLGELP